MYSFNNYCFYSYFLIFHFETGSNRKLKTKKWRTSLPSVASQMSRRVGKNRAKEQFQGHTGSYCEVIPLKERLIQNSRTVKARNGSFWAERDRKPAVASFSRRCKTLKEDSSGVPAIPMQPEGHPLNCISIRPSPATLLFLISFLAQFCELCCRQQGHQHDQEAGLKG